MTRILALEGPDGCGKSTHADRLAAALRAEGVALDGHHATRAAREVVTALRDRLTARLAWHEAMARGCRYALAVVEAEVSRG